MKVLSQRVFSNPSYAKALEWAKLITITGSAQTLVQVLGLVSGILVIRLLPTQEYALYTLANTMLGTMTILADGGITAGVMAQGGKVWQEKDKLGVVLITGLELRKQFAIGSLLISTPILLYLLRHQGASWLMCVLLIASLIPAFTTALSSSILEVAPKLRQDITLLQKNRVSATLGRLAALAPLLFPFPFAFMAVLAAGLPQIWANKGLRKISSKYVNWNNSANPVIRQEILVFVRRILPYSVYYCLSGQITIWIISYFGSNTDVAQAGALGRLTILLSVFSIMFGTLIIPRFARIEIHSGQLFKKYIFIQIFLILFCLCIIGFTYAFPNQILWILGKKYAGLRVELVLSIIASCLGLLAGTAYTLFTSRGWTISPFIAIPINLIATVCAVMILDISSLKGVLLLSIFIETIQAVMNIAYGAFKSFASSRQFVVNS
jgi:O-antigen/teichoic acid export membrane protein